MWKVNAVNWNHHENHFKISCPSQVLHVNQSSKIKATTSQFLINHA